MTAWAIWLIASIILIIIELVSGTAACLCLAGGCLAGMAASLFGTGLVWQVSIAVLATILMLITAGPALRKVYARHAGNKHYATGMDALVGRVGIVTHEVTTQAENKGRVRIDGDNWMAYTDPQFSPIPHGTQVVVEAYESIVIKVRPFEK